VARQVHRLPERLHNRCHVLELPFYRVVVRIAAASATAPIDGVDGEAFLKSRQYRPPAAVICRRPVNHHQGRSFP
jgi:hypothetical protein